MVVSALASEFRCTRRRCASKSMQTAACARDVWPSSAIIASLIEFLLLAYAYSGKRWSYKEWTPSPLEIMSGKHIKIAAPNVRVCMHSQLPVHANATHDVRMLCEQCPCKCRLREWMVAPGWLACLRLSKCAAHLEMISRNLFETSYHHITNLLRFSGRAHAKRTAYWKRFKINLTSRSSHPSCVSFSISKCHASSRRTRDTT